MVWHSTRRGRARRVYFIVKSWLASHLPPRGFFGGQTIKKHRWIKDFSQHVSLYLGQNPSWSARYYSVPAMSEQRLKMTLADIEAARQTIAGHVLRTPMLAAPPLSALTSAQIYVKYENLQ